MKENCHWKELYIIDHRYIGKQIQHYRNQVKGEDSVIGMLFVIPF